MLTAICMIVITLCTHEKEGIRVGIVEKMSGQLMSCDFVSWVNVHIPEIGQITCAKILPNCKLWHSNNRLFPYHSATMICAHSINKGQHASKLELHCWFTCEEFIWRLFSIDLAQTSVLPKHLSYSRSKLELDKFQILKTVTRAAIVMVIFL